MRILFIFMTCGSVFGFQADFSNDNIVNFQDFVIFASQWMQNESPSIQNLKWNDNPAMASNNPAARAVFGDWLVGGDAPEVDSNGITVSYGEFTKYGGMSQFADYSARRFWRAKIYY
jgi:hypothetical protein